MPGPMTLVGDRAFHGFTTPIGEIEGTMLMANLINSGLWLQSSDSLSAGNTKLLMIFIGIVAFSALIQACVLIGIAIGASKAQKKLLEIAQDLHTAAMPAIRNVQELVTDATPKVRIITENLLETSYVVRAKAQELDATLSDVNNRTRSQVAQVDSLITNTLKAASDIAATVQHSIRVPVREMAGVVNGLKAGLDVLVGRVKGFGSGSSGFGAQATRPVSIRPATKTGGDSDLIL